jgi:hypothetical protein
VVARGEAHAADDEEGDELDERDGPDREGRDTPG